MNTFNACMLPWSIYPSNLTLTHTDTDVVPVCSVEFSAQVVRAAPPYEQLWVRADFRFAGFASAKPHRDDEELQDVSGYDIVPRRGGVATWQRDQDEWLRTGVCPDPAFYYSTATSWLDAERESWASRQRGGGSAVPVHFLLDGRDGYIEILAAGFAWRAWHPGHPRLSAVSGDPIMSGEWER